MNFYLSYLQRISFFILFILISITSFAQSGTIRGTVTDVSGAPLAGASVILDGRSGGTIPDNSGSFTLTASPGRHTLIISFVGYGTTRTQVTVTANETVVQNIN
ncbi:MAG: carboxypeptidase regulatory-like domain-containing protein, partial [Chitinophagaceae bacterium]